MESVKQKQHFSKKWNKRNLLHRKVVYQPIEHFVCNGFWITIPPKKCCFYLTAFHFANFWKMSKNDPKMDFINILDARITIKTVI